MRIDVAGVVPMFGADTYVAARARMRGKALGSVPVADGSGPEFDVGELVTVPAVTWRPVDDDTVDVVLTDHGTTVTARVSVDEIGRVLDVSSTGRCPGAGRRSGPCRTDRTNMSGRGWTPRPSSGRSRPRPVPADRGGPPGSAERISRWAPTVPGRGVATRIAGCRARLRRAVGAGW